MKFIKYYLVSFLVILVFCYQLFLVNHGLNRWKGGGFGMYSDYHIYHYDLKINGVSYKKDSIYSNKKYNSVIKNYQYFPNSENTTKLISKLKLNKDMLNLKIYQPKLNTENMQLSKKLRYEGRNF